MDGGKLRRPSCANMASRSEDFECVPIDAAMLANLFTSKMYSLFKCGDRSTTPEQRRNRRPSEIAVGLVGNRRRQNATNASTDRIGSGVNSFSERKNISKSKYNRGMSWMGLEAAWNTSIRYCRMVSIPSPFRLLTNENPKMRNLTRNGLKCLANHRCTILYRSITSTLDGQWSKWVPTKRICECGAELTMMCR